MKSSKDYSVQELAAMSWEELVAHLPMLREQQLAGSALKPLARSSTPPMQPEALRVIGGI